MAKININIDKLRLCYVQPEHLIADIMDRADDSEWIDYGEFSFHLQEVEKEDEVVKQITADLFLHGVIEGYEKTHLGTFVFNNSAKYRGKCFFAFANKSLYIIGSKYQRRKYNLIGYLTFVTDRMGLLLNNVTELELACDTDINIVMNIRRFITNYDDYEMFQNGRIIHDHKKRLSGYCEIFGRSRARLERTPSLYVKQAGIGIPFHLKAYNKTEEMREESPEKTPYISEWNGFGENRKIYRVEVRMGNTDFRTWLSYLNSESCPYPKEWAEPLQTLNMLLMDEYRWALWIFCCKRLLYFRNRADGTEVTLLDIVGGKRP